MSRIHRIAGWWYINILYTVYMDVGSTLRNTTSRGVLDTGIACHNTWCALHLPNCLSSLLRRLKCIIRERVLKLLFYQTLTTHRRMFSPALRSPNSLPQASSRSHYRPCAHTFFILFAASTASIAQMLEGIATRLETIASGLEAIAIWLEAIAIGVEVIAIRKKGNNFSVILFNSPNLVA